MATITAQIQVGHGHQNHGGINPSHYLFLSENSRPAWILVPQNVFPVEREEKNIKNEDRIVWIPSQEGMLEDAILMIAYYILQDKKVCDILDEYLGNKPKDSIEVHSDIPEEVRTELYQICRSFKIKYKILVLVMDGSAIYAQIKALDLYNMDLEICSSVYSRFSNPFKDETIETGVII